ncbi:MAG: hypothetical protein IPJ06_14870 [Saprospiraceae bacterium]|nr:hypothetical protein [Saprospiraceae bacterium]
MRLTIVNPYDITGDREGFIETRKFDTQSEKHHACLIPENTTFHRMDGLLTEIRQFLYVEDKYATDQDPDTRHILREFKTIREEKQRELASIIRTACGQRIS